MPFGKDYFHSPPPTDTASSVPFQFPLLKLLWFVYESKGRAETGSQRSLLCRGEKMERKVLVVCIAVGFLGIFASALGFAAEAKRIKGSEVQFTAPGMCTYPRSPSLGLGLTASVSLVIAQMIINVAAGCICCRRNQHLSNFSWTVQVVCFVFSWFTFVIAFLLLLTGAALNDQHGEESMYFGNYCYVVKPGVFSGGALLSLASVTLGILYYLTLSSAKSHDNPNPGITMAQPQFPPPSAQPPVFVPEDTYNRRQYP